MKIVQRKDQIKAWSIALFVLVLAVVWNRRLVPGLVRSRRSRAADLVRRAGGGLSQIPPRSAAGFPIEPFARMAARAPDPVNDVTVVTQCSTDRLDRIAFMAEAYGGPISVAAYVTRGASVDDVSFDESSGSSGKATGVAHDSDQPMQSGEDRDQALSVIRALVARSPAVARHVDFHLLFSNRTRYPVNNLRNLALINARTDLVFSLDADFVTAPGLHQYLARAFRSPAVAQALVDGGADPAASDLVALVVPTFSSGLDGAGALPRSKVELKEHLSRGLVSSVNVLSCPKCHRPTNYRRWLTARSPFLAQYRWIYEPYFVISRSRARFGPPLNADANQQQHRRQQPPPPPRTAPLFDERFKGYGFDKNSHSFVLAAHGYKFVVLPEAYAVHLNHPVQLWGGGKPVQEQQWDVLPFVCLLMNETKLELGIDPAVRLFDEPIGEDCMTRDHW